ncbi:kelch repeat protein [Grosmannia clavigera kw1407]|uniref:Kelch repeat protein n=1 Tax=Grosmannia clavigera (strain kw1407 / UAMH 11150) TaxID=655863 RepID=F0XCX2_GROCL|nr:kelch repeat protein [Grosmannia clavigera kw1407]EFX03849.1 kelch repeat protein [Grosmannia clavigera kw1407]
MEQITQLKRRTTDMIQSIPQSIPQSLPQMPQFPQMPRLPHISALSSFTKPGSHDSHYTLKGTWQRVAIPALPRSSHSMDVVAGTAYVFGGESTSARQPTDNSMHAIILPTGSATADYYAIKAVSAKPEPVVPISVPIIQEPTSESEPVDTSEPETAEEEDADGQKRSVDKGKAKEEPVEEIPLSGPALGSVPEPRVGHATAVIGNRIFLFGGRGGPAMAPLEERGRVWVFDTKAHTWSFLDPLAPPVAAPLQAMPEEGDTGLGTTAASRPVFPAARSYHAAVAWNQPGSSTYSNNRHRRATSWVEWVEGDSAEVGTPQRPIVGKIAERARDVDSDGYGSFFVHGGCLADGSRTNDLWAFDVRTRTWKELPSAPGLPRGGTALCLSGGRLYRFGGYNGVSEEGGRLDFLALGLSSSGETSAEPVRVTVAAKGGWHSLISDTVVAVESSREKEEEAKAAAAVSAEAAEKEDEEPTTVATDVSASTEYKGAVAVTTTPAAPGVSAAPAPTIIVSGPEDVWPGARSVASLESVSVGGGWEYLLLALGERSPSGTGHEAAGVFWDDVWAFQVPSDRFSAAGVSDAVTSAVHNVRSKLPRGWFGSLNGSTGQRQGEGRWARLVTAPYDADEAEAEGHGGSDVYGPGPRGWAASAPLRELEENAIVIFGGLNDTNNRLGDAWILRLGDETIEQS